MSSDESLTRAEELLKRVEDLRAELERISEAEEGSPERAIELLGELSELASRRRSSGSISGLSCTGKPRRCATRWRSAASGCVP